MNDYINNEEYPMSTMIKINLKNLSSSVQEFFFFQQPAVYTGGANVYANSIQNIQLAPYVGSGSTYTFLINMQFYAGTQQSSNLPQIGQQTGYLSAIQPIDLALAAGGGPTNNTTVMSVGPFGLTTPDSSAPDVQPGAFRIVSPIFDSSLYYYYGGSAVTLADGSVVLSNFATMNPNSNLDCQPVLKFYVQTGAYTAGTVMNFTSSSTTAALCDATSGFTTFDVVYNVDGTWGITSSTS
jgi:hypothetical protein